jgi:hypothetical protein
VASQLGNLQILRGCWHAFNRPTVVKQQFSDSARQQSTDSLDRLQLSFPDRSIDVRDSRSIERSKRSILKLCEAVSHAELAVPIECVPISSAMNISIIAQATEPLPIRKHRFRLLSDLVDLRNGVVSKRPITKLPYLDLKSSLAFNFLSSTDAFTRPRINFTRDLRTVLSRLQFMISYN